MGGLDDDDNTSDVAQNLTQRLVTHATDLTSIALRGAAHATFRDAATQRYQRVPDPFTLSDTAFSRSTVGKSISTSPLRLLVFIILWTKALRQAVHQPGPGGLIALGRGEIHVRVVPPSLGRLPDSSLRPTDTEALVGEAAASTSSPRPLNKPVVPSPPTPARARSKQPASKLSTTGTSSPQVTASRRTGETSQRRQRDGKRADSGVGELLTQPAAGVSGEVGPTGTPGLLSLSRPGEAAGASKSARRNAPRRRERRKKAVKTGTGSGEEDEDEQNGNDDDEEDDEEILFQPGQEPIKPARPAHKRTMSEPTSVNGAVEAPPPAQATPQSRSKQTRKSRPSSKDGLDKDMAQLSMTGPEEDAAPVSSRTRRKQAEASAAGETSGPDRPGQSSAHDTRKRTKAVAIAASPARGGSGGRAQADVPLSKSVPSGWTAQQTSTAESGYDTAREGRGGKGKGRVGRNRAADEEDMLWEMPDLKEVKSDGSGLTWQQLELAGSPLDPRRAGKSTRSSGLNASTSSPGGNVTRRARLDNPLFSASEREDAALSGSPANAARASGRRKADSARMRGGTTESQEDSDVFPSHPELRKSKTLAAGTPKKTVQPSAAMYTPQRERPAPAHTVSAPANAPLKGTPLSSAVYAGPKFHNSPSAEHLPAPRLLREH